MALLKEITNEKGISTNYHKISSVTLRDNVVTCHLDSYVSKDYRELGQSADSFAFRFSTGVEEEESMGIRALCYTKIKALANWAEATDC